MPLGSALKKKSPRFASCNRRRKALSKQRRDAREERFLLKQGEKFEENGPIAVGHRTGCPLS